MSVSMNLVTKGRSVTDEITSYWQSQQQRRKVDDMAATCLLGTDEVGSSADGKSVCRHLEKSERTARRC